MRTNADARVTAIRKDMQQLEAQQQEDMSKSICTIRDTEHAEATKLLHELQEQKDLEIEACTQKTIEHSEVIQQRNELETEARVIEKIELEHAEASKHIQELKQQNEMEVEAAKHKDSEHRNLLLELQQQEQTQVEVAGIENNEHAEVSKLLDKLQQQEQMEADACAQKDSELANAYQELHRQKEEDAEARSNKDIENTKISSRLEELQREKEIEREVCARQESEMEESTNVYKRAVGMANERVGILRSELSDSRENAELEAARLGKELEENAMATKAQLTTLESELAHMRREMNAQENAQQEELVAALGFQVELNPNNKDPCDMRQASEWESRQKKTQSALLEELRTQRMKFDNLMNWAKEHAMTLLNAEKGICAAEVHVRKLAQVLEPRLGDHMGFLEQTSTDLVETGEVTQTGLDAMVAPEETAPETVCLNGALRSLGEATLALHEASHALDCLSKDAAAWRQSAEARTTCEAHLQAALTERAALFRVLRDTSPRSCVCGALVGDLVEDDSIKGRDKETAVRVFKAERTAIAQRRDEGSVKTSCAMSRNMRGGAKIRDQAEAPEVTAPQALQLTKEGLAQEMAPAEPQHTWVHETYNRELSQNFDT